MVVACWGCGVLVFLMVLGGIDLITCGVCLSLVDMMFTCLFYSLKEVVIFLKMSLLKVT